MTVAAIGLLVKKEIERIVIKETSELFRYIGAYALAFFRHDLGDAVYGDDRRPQASRDVRKGAGEICDCGLPAGGLSKRKTSPIQPRLRENGSQGGSDEDSKYKASELRDAFHVDSSVKKTNANAAQERDVPEPPYRQMVAAKLRFLARNQGKTATGGMVMA
ncbi:MAG: hypothetical protein CL681_18010 [Blastopirellula sp.]|nr:hypothetical protein [Blastopirellula sp.]